MATKIFDETETTYTGTSGSDFIVGNDLANTIDGAAGNDIISGAGGDDFIVGGAGNDVLSGGNGNDFILTGSLDGLSNSGDNVISGGAGDDNIFTGTGDDIISGGGGNDTILSDGGDNIISGDAGQDNIATGDGDDIISGGAGDDDIYAGTGDDILSGGDGADYIEGQGSTAGNESVTGNLYYVTSTDALIGGAGNDTFSVDDEFEEATVIQGNVAAQDISGNAARYVDLNEAEGEEEEEEEGGEEEEGPLFAYDTVNSEFVEIEDQDMSEQAETDVRLNLSTRPGSSEINTAATTVAGYNAVDTIKFNDSGEFGEALKFSGIERVELASGVDIMLSAEQFEFNGESLGLGFLNPGTQVYGVAGGDAESATVELEFEDAEFEPEDDITGATSVEYDAAEFSVEEYSVANLFHNVDMIYDASEGEAGSFTRVYGGNESVGASETGYGSEGVDFATMNGGNDTYYGGDGNDVLAGQSGADSLYGEEGDDIFTIDGFGSGNSGTTSAADDGTKEWVATGADHDLIVGGDGVDTLRVTSGVGADTETNGTVVLNDGNFQSMEVVQVGATVDQLNVENDALQMLNDHYYFQANGNVDDLSNTLGNNSGTIGNVVVDASGVTANGLRFEGNADDNTFIGTTQDDTFVGNSGDDELTGGNGADTFVFGKVSEQVVTGDDDTVQTYTETAFDLSGIDTITDFVSGTDTIALNTDMFSSLTAGSFTSGNLVCSVGATAVDADDYLLFDTSTNALSYDADGNGAGSAVQFATLTGVSSFSASDVEVFA